MLGHEMRSLLPLSVNRDTAAAAKESWRAWRRRAVSARPSNSTSTRSPKRIYVKAGPLPVGVDSN